ncbi:MAG: RidA family protein [Motiliproteus sp.]
MTIERIESTERMSRIVKHNGTVYLCGQTAGQADWDIAEQTRHCLVKVDALLAKAGSHRDRILSVTIYIRDMKDFAAMNAIWDAWVAAGEKPARACVEARMARPEVLVEMSVVAGCLIADSPSYKLA